jgi:hypothetical protein
MIFLHNFEIKYLNNYCEFPSCIFGTFYSYDMIILNFELVVLLEADYKSLIRKFMYNFILKRLFLARGVFFEHNCT